MESSSASPFCTGSGCCIFHTLINYCKSKQHPIVQLYIAL